MRHALRHLANHAAADNDERTQWWLAADDIDMAWEPMSARRTE
ncbi:MAG TPA: hypothetical protein VIG71_07400 [Enteractinococcus sp.]